MGMALEKKLAMKKRSWDLHNIEICFLILRFTVLQISPTPKTENEKKPVPFCKMQTAIFEKKPGQIKRSWVSEKS